jgi:hypothetical protein
MNDLMNIYEANEPVLGVPGFEKKYALFFFFGVAFWLFLGSQMFICFINIVMRSKIRGFVRQMLNKYHYFMNLMNIYEVRVFNRFFGIVRFLDGKLMNMVEGVTSYMFINSVVGFQQLAVWWFCRSGAL